MAKNWGCYVSGSKCYNNDPANCDKYGRLYNWATAMALDASCNDRSCASQIKSPHRGICPEGWHIPSDAEWTTLTNYVGGASTAGTKLKSREGWNSYSGAPLGTDVHGFSALPGGNGYSDGSFHDVGDAGYWWSASEYYSYLAYGRGMSYNGEGVYNNISFTKDNLYSVRCLQD